MQRLKWPAARASTTTSFCLDSTPCSTWCMLQTFYKSMTRVEDEVAGEQRSYIRYDGSSSNAVGKASVRASIYAETRSQRTQPNQVAQYTSTFYRLCFCLHSCNWNLSQCARHFCKLILLFLYRGLDIKYIVTIKTISAVPVYANKLNVSCRLYVYNTWNSTDTKRMKLSRLQLHHLCICRLVHGSASKQMYFTPLPCHVSDYCLPSCSSRWIHFLGII